MTEPRYPMTDAELEAYLETLPKPGPLRDAWNRVTWPARWYWGMVWADYALLRRSAPCRWRRLRNLRSFAHCARTAFPHAVALVGRMFE